MSLPQTQLYTEDDYYSLPEGVRAELIDGQLYDQAAPSRIHQKVLMFLSKTISNYIDTKGGPCEVYPAPFAVKLNDDVKTIVEPDISVICDPGKLTDKGCTGAPDWIIEITSPGNSSQDYIRKLYLYAAAGVREYWIVNPIKKNIYVYHLQESAFDTIIYTFQDQVKVGIYDDLSIDFRDIRL